jgi:hypothetical protein
MAITQRHKNLIARGIRATAARRRDKKLPELKALFALGMNLEKSLQRIGISDTTYYRWLDEVDGLREEIQRIKLDPLIQAHQTWRTALINDPKLAYEYLKTKEPDEFKTPTTKVELSGSVASGDTNPKMADAIAVAVTDELRRRNIEANKDDGK